MTHRDPTRLILVSSLSLASALLAAGCDWTVFDDLEETAPVRMLAAPDNYRGGGYGQVVVSAQPTIGGKQVSRIIASAGGSSTIIIERAWDGEKLTSENSIRCKDKDDCNEGIGVGATLISVPLWGKNSEITHYGCVFAPADPTGYMLCETNASQNQKVALGRTGPDKAAAGFGGASIPEAFTDVGVALVGQYWLEERTQKPLTGGLYYLPDQVSATNTRGLAELKAINPRTGELFSAEAAPNDFGYAVAAAENTAGELLVAVSQPAKNRVIVLSIDPGATEDDVQDKLHTRACIKSPNPELVGFGKVLTFGDVTGDGEPDLFAGIDPVSGENKTLQRVYMYDGRSLPAKDAVEPGLCPLWDDEPQNVGCYDGIGGITCKDSGFGASLAVGDVDGDGVGDLIAGAPLATVQGVKNTGVVWVIPGSDQGLDFDAMVNVYGSDQDANARVGTSVAALRTQDRDEPVAGAPGSKAVYVFMCSRLETDLPASALCLPK